MIAVTVGLALTGCGGGSANNNPYGTVRGIANINAAAETPRAETAFKDSGGIWQTLTSTNLNRPSSGWQDENFDLQLPSPNGHDLCAVWVMNGASALGVYDGYLFFNSHTGLWELWQFSSGSSDILILSNAAQDNYGDLRIDAVNAQVKSAVSEKPHNVATPDEVFQKLDDEIAGKRQRVQ